MSPGTSFRTAIAPASLVQRLKEVALKTWDLGITAFGGPPVHFQILHQRFVVKERWVDEQTVGRRCTSPLGALVQDLTILLAVPGAVRR